MSAFSFTKLVVRDLENSERFYCAVFGLEPAHRLTADEHEYALEEVVLSPGGQREAHVLILSRYLTRPCPPTGAAWTGFVVDDLDAVVATAKNLGGKVAVGIHDNAEHGVRAVLLEDPEGHMIEAVQYFRSG